MNVCEVIVDVSRLLSFISDTNLERYLRPALIDNTYLKATKSSGNCFECLDFKYYMNGTFFFKDNYSFTIDINDCIPKVTFKTLGQELADLFKDCRLHFEFKIPCIVTSGRLARYIKYDLGRIGELTTHDQVTIFENKITCDILNTMWEIPLNVKVKKVIYIDVPPYRSTCQFRKITRTDNLPYHIIIRPDISHFKEVMDFFFVEINYSTFEIIQLDGYDFHIYDPYYQTKCNAIVLCNHYGDILYENTAHPLFADYKMGNIYLSNMKKTLSN